MSGYLAASEHVLALLAALFTVVALSIFRSWPMFKSVRLGLPALLLAITVASPAFAHPRYYPRAGYYPRTVDGRQFRQQQRLYDGYVRGQLSPGEYTRLQRRAWEIELQQRRYRWNDGYISPQERYRLNRRLDRLSDSIYDQRRD
jgi:hypothetical protein